MEIDNSDLKHLILGTFKYSLGRMTYMPNLTLNMFRKYKGLFSEDDWRRVLNEIEECPDFGMEGDRRTWLSLKQLCLRGIDRYKSKIQNKN